MTKNKITEGNSFALNIRQAVWRTLGGVIQPLLASELVDVHLYVGSGTSKSTATEYNVTADGDTISAVMPATLKRGVYRTWMTALYQGREVASACECAFEIVAFDEHGIYAPERIDGQPCVYLQGASMTDPEIEQYKARLLELQQQREQEVQALEEERKRIADIVVQLDGIATETKQDELAQQLVLIKQAISETAKASDIPTDYARNETLLANTMLLAEKASQSSVTDLANEMASRLAEVRASIDTITAIDSDIRAGKAALAENIRLKGVSSSATDSLIGMAEEVRQIAQQQITFESTEEYEKQMFGAPTIPTGIFYKQEGPLWNLYKVMTELLSDGRFVTYGGIVLAEYDLRYPSIDLSGAGAGGAYFTSDGSFYTQDVTHIWHDDTMANRWVAYLFKNASTNFIVASVKTRPVNVHIGRAVGDYIDTLANCDTRNFIVTDGNTLGCLRVTNKTNWTQTVVLRNIVNQQEAVVDSKSPVKSIVIKANTISNYIVRKNSQVSSVTIDVENTKKGTIFIDFDEVQNVTGSGIKIDLNVFFVKPTELKNARIISADLRSQVINRVFIRNLIKVDISEEAGVFYTYHGHNSTITEIHLPDLIEGLSKLTNNDRNSKTFISVEKIVCPKHVAEFSLLRGITGSTEDKLASLIDLEVGEQIGNMDLRVWKALPILADEEKCATLNENIRNHMAARVSDRTGQDALTVTFSTDMYNALEQATFDAFAAKNWNVAGA